MRRNRPAARLLAALVATTGALAVTLTEGTGVVPTHSGGPGPVIGAAAGKAAASGADAVRRSGPVLQTFPLSEEGRPDTAGTLVPAASPGSAASPDAAVSPGSAAAPGLAAAPDLAAAPGSALLPASVALPGSVASSAPAGRGARVASMAAQITEPFSLVGVTWADARLMPAGVIEVRTRRISTGAWTEWQPLETDNPDASAGTEGVAVRGSSDPLWVGPSDGVQTRVVGIGGADPFPEDLRVDLINPDGVNIEELDVDDRSVKPSSVKPSDIKPSDIKTSSAKTSNVVDRMDARNRRSFGPAVAGRHAVGVAPGLMPPSRPVPRMVSRSAWRADEKMVVEPPEYTGAVHVVFVHHTASGNGYECTESARIVRGIEAFHVRSKGWNDIGYNFLVDKCGRIFEGRAGGITRSVLGAHTMGFNENASAVAVIGDYRSRGIPIAARAAVAQLAAYKLGAWGNPPLGKAGLLSGGSNRYPKGTRAILNRISGHRDAGRTECPGNSLYAQLPGIRAVAGAAPAKLRLRGVNGTREHAGRYYTRGPAGPAWDLNTPSRMMARFEVYVDGELTASAPPGHRQAGVRLEPGTHRVTVRAVHLSGRVATTTTRVTADPVAPKFAGTPLVSLREGSVGVTAPVQVGWSVTDTSGLSGVRVTGAASGSLTGTARSLSGTVGWGDPATWNVTATDRAGNVSTASVTRTPMVSVDASKTGTWRAIRDQRHLGGEAVAASAAGASLTWTFTGSSVALLAGRTANSGRVRVYLDGEFQGIVDLRSTAPQFARAVWTRSWRASGTHTIRVQAEGTTGRPSVVLDGLAYLR
ncbi:MAG TPA: N-acetylmuramoyl-L-alanine amidase [Actinoplanes sp.]|nr:N-acetylmuramoyl-L-alanine amidase [Actinoplanes sp.]